MPDYRLEEETKWPLAVKLHNNNKKSEKTFRGPKILGPFFINIIMSQLQQIRDLIRSGNFDQAKEELLNNSSNFVLSNNQPLVPYKRLEEVNIDPFNSKYDRGSGRISKGMRFLELIALMFKGKTVTSMLNFDRIPQYTNPSEFLQNNSEERKIELVSISLGIEEPLAIMRTKDRAYYDAFTQILLNTYNSVESAEFRYDDNKEILALCRGLYRRVES